MDINKMENNDDLSSNLSKNIGIFVRIYEYIRSISKRYIEKIVDFVLLAKKIGQDDPRRIVHAFKVGLAITIVSLFYYFQPLYDGFGVSAMWAVLTVVVVFEYSVGATLGKGFNRMIATCIAGFLGVSAHHLANLSGKIGEPILLSFFSFLIAGIMTFMRFFPKLKARHDYGLMIFILTFSLVAVSGYRDDEVIKMAEQRLSTIIIGSLIAMLICVCVCPVWNGAELHELVASNLEKLGTFLQGFGEEYFKTSIEGKSKEKFSRDVYKSILGSKSIEETHANLAAWEPSHGRFRFRHPWKQYLKIGSLARQCAYRVDALNTYLDSNKQQTPKEIQNKIKEVTIKLSSELGKVLTELSSEIKKMKKTSTVKNHVIKSKSIAQDLKMLLQDGTLWEKFSFIDILPTATIASILIEIVSCVDNISKEVNELAIMAHFKSMDCTIGPKDEQQEISQQITSEHNHAVTTKDDNNHNHVATTKDDNNHNHVVTIKDDGEIHIVVDNEAKQEFTTTKSTSLKS